MNATAIPAQQFGFSLLSHRLDGESAQAWQVHDRAMTLKSNGEDVVVLSIGDPDFRTPQPIIDNAVSHVRVGRTHYSPALGEINLRRAVADYESRVSPHPCQVEHVSIFPGVTAALYAVLSCLMDSGDELITVDPWYVGYEPICDALNVKMRTVIAKPENGFEPRVSDLTAACTENTKVMLLNTPANPTGAIIPRQTLAELAAFCHSAGIWLVCDEVYSMFTYEKPHVSLRTAAAALDNVVVVDGLSKSHAMSGWRMGWVVTTEALTRHLGNFAAMSMFGCPQFIQDAAAFALNNDEYYVREMCAIYQKRRDIVCDALQSIPNISFIRPGSGMFVMVDVRKLDKDDTKFCSELLDSERLALLPGSAFGVATQGHARMSLVQPENVLLDGCQRLKRFVESRIQ